MSTADTFTPMRSGAGSHHSGDDALGWRCRRGLLELDLWLGGFWARQRATLDPIEKAAFERLLTLSDMEILDRLNSPVRTGDPALDRLVQRIHDTPIHA